MTHLRGEVWSGGAGWSLLGFPEDLSFSKQLEGVEVVDDSEICTLDHRARVKYEIRRVDSRECPAARAAAAKLDDALRISMRVQLENSPWQNAQTTQARSLDSLVLSESGYRLQFEGSTVILSLGATYPALADPADALLEAVRACAARVQPIIRETPVY